MILNTITVHNFMSYGDASLDLSACDVACLSGFNGAGKSAILDAVTWALWESARSTSDELIRAGEQEMWVDLVFALEGQTYRVRRSRSRVFARGGTRASSKGTLEFQISAHHEGNGGGNGRKTAKNGKNGGSNGKNGDGNGTNGDGDSFAWQTLTAASMRETQTRICELLRMDYDTFINSVYLRQGRADEFTTRPPAERKQVLAEILGLAYFDRLQELARENARQRKADMEALEASLGNQQQLSETLADARRQWHELTNRLKATGKLRDEKRTALRVLQDNISELLMLEKQLEPTRQRLAEIEEDIAGLQSSDEQTRARLQEVQQLLASVQDAESITARFQTLRSQVEKLDNISLERQDFEKRRLELKSAIATARGRMEVELEHIQSQTTSLAATIEKLRGQVTAKDKLSTEYENFKRLIKQESEMSQRQEAFAQLNARAEQLHTAIVECRFQLEAQLGLKQQTLGELQELMQSRNTLEKDGAELQRQLELLDAAEAQFEIVEQQGIKLKQDIDAIDAEIAQHQRQKSENDHKCQELHEAKSLSMCPLCAAPIVDKSAVLDRYKGLQGELDSRINELESKKATLEQKRGELRHQYVDLKRKLDSRKALDVRIGEFNARKAALERADATYQRLATEVADMAERLSTQRYAEVEKESLINIKAEIHKIEFDPVIYSSLQAQIRALRNVEFRYQQFKRDEADLQQAERDLPELEQKAEQLKTSLEQNDFAPEQRAEITELDSKLELLPYDRTEHQAMKQELSGLLPLIDKLKDIERALAEKPQLLAQSAATTEKLAVRQTQKRELEESIGAWTSRLTKLESLREEQQKLTAHLDELDQEFQKHDREAIVLNTNVEHYEQQLAQLEEKQQQLTTLLMEINDYNVLAEAFGKKGIQAVIIENAVPEIEAEANRILSRLSDNQMHVALITQQRTKQGTLFETLEIVIADQLGTRAYELYSGGEAFKINFSIRLALSRLLARRAGAKLQTLIIDEGFGSQDEASRARLVKAINAIRSDFARILIVTHIAEIKDLFPIQIQVQKTNGVSSLNLVHAF